MQYDNQDETQNHSPAPKPAKPSHKTVNPTTDPTQQPAWTQAMRDQPPPGLQAKLTVSQPGDVYEQEADHVADQVMHVAVPGMSVVQEDTSLMRKPSGGGAQATPDAPSVVNQALSSGGQPLDASTRATMEPRFGHDFSQVKIHTDEQAAESAQAVSARAYTVGRDVVFGAGRYAPETSEGQRLLAHELTHVVQQSSSAIGPGVQRDVLPGYAQKGDTCKPASLLTALIIWDRERAVPANPNANVVGLCDAGLIYMAQNRSTMISKLSSGGADGLKQYNDAIATLTKIGDDNRKPGSIVTESQFQDIATILSNIGADEATVMARLGLGSKDDAQNTLAAIFTSPALTGLTPGQMAQIEWYVRTKVRVASTGVEEPSQGYHAFLIGRKQTGTWFLADQGNKPPLNLEAADLPTLKIELDKAAAAGRSWIVTDPSVSRLQLTWTGIHVLEKPAFDEIHKKLAPAGTFLAEVDAGWLTTGERVFSWGFTGIVYDFKDVKPLLSSSMTPNDHGFLIGEMPTGVFNIYPTNPVSEANLDTNSIDEGDSAGGLLIQSPQVFKHVWLQLVSSKGRWKSTFINVY